MSGPPPWEIVETEDLQDCKVFRVRRTLARSPRTGDVHPFFRIDCDEWVNVVPVTPAGEVVMVRQYRHGAGRVTLEIPGGIIDPGESPQTGAARELLEETGYRARALEAIGVVNPNPALFGNSVHTFLAHDAEPVGAIQNTGMEETAIELVRVEEIPDRLRDGAIDHALVVAALHWFALARGGGTGESSR